MSTVTALPTAAAREQAKAQHPATVSKQVCPPHAALLHRIASMITTEDLPPAQINIHDRNVIVDCSGSELVQGDVRRWAQALDLIVTEIAVDNQDGTAATLWSGSGWDGTGCWWHVAGSQPVPAVTS